MKTAIENIQAAVEDADAKLDEFAGDIIDLRQQVNTLQGIIASQNNQDPVLQAAADKLELKLAEVSARINPPAEAPVAASPGTGS